MLWRLKRTKSFYLQISLKLLNLYPNPNDGSFLVQIETFQDQDVIMRVFDAQGKLVWERFNNSIKGKHTEKIEITGLKSGIFHLQVILGDGTKSRSFVVE